MAASIKDRERPNFGQNFCYRARFGSYVVAKTSPTHCTQTAVPLNGETNWKIHGGTQGKESSTRVNIVDSRSCLRQVRRIRGLLLPIRLPALLDKIGVYVFDILVIQDVLEALHALWGKGPAEQDILERRMNLRRHLPQIGRNIRPKRMAA
jgi:hypothetical protein